MRPAREPAPGGVGSRPWNLDRRAMSWSSRAATSRPGPRSRRRGRAGTRGSRPSSRPTAAWPTPTPSASRPPASSATSTPPIRRGSRRPRRPASGSCARRSPRTSPTPSWRVIEAVRLGATTVTILGALGGPRLDHALANVWLLALPALAGIPAVLLDEHARVSLLTAPSTGRRRRPAPPRAARAAPPSPCSRSAATSRASRRPACAIRSATSPSLTGPARGLSNVVTGPDAAVALRRGRLLVIEAADADGGLSSEP